MMLITKQRNTATRRWLSGLLPVLIGFSAAEAHAGSQVQLTAALGTPIMKANLKQSAYLQIALEGFGLEGDKKRTPVNMAIVIDRSGSMSGDKIIKAKEAALMVVDRLGAQDVLSVVTYESGVQILIPAMPVNDREWMRNQIRSIQPAGSTALFAGVSKGLEEVQKFLDRNKVNRVILLSDGQANVGPSSPNELARLGLSAVKSGISISTIGLGDGYNEDLMSQLANASDGSHGFAHGSEELAKIFDAELGDVLTVVAQEVSMRLKFAPGVRPVRALNREAEIRGDTVILSMNQLYGRQRKFFLLEVEVPAGAQGSNQEIAQVDLSYANMVTGATDRVKAAVAAKFSSDEAMISQATNQEVMVAALEAVATERNRMAVALRDEGKVQEARTLFKDNASFLRSSGIKYKSKKLDDYGTANEEASENLDEGNWNVQRKKARKEQITNLRQQSY